MSLLALVIVLGVMLLFVLGIAALFGVVLVAGRTGRRAQVRETGSQSIA
ncbi:hypothetical protein [Nocardioides sp. BYT-33-1]|jgi:hypothetical protein